MPRSLDRKEVRNILRTTNLAKGVEWPTKEDRERLYNAYQENLDEVTFTNGKRFSIRYNYRAASLGRGSHDQVYIKPVGEERFPCGWFDVGRLLVNG